MGIVTLNNQQMNIPSPSPSLPPLLYGGDKAFPIPMAGSGAKPKTGVSKKIPFNMYVYAGKGCISNHGSIL